VENEDEMRAILPVVEAHQVPVTFRAAGTSLSGQAVTDSVLLKISHQGKSWRAHEISDGGRQIKVQPGLIGGEVNRLLAAFKRREGHADQFKLGPDPASIESCMIGESSRISHPPQSSHRDR
jgi:D-lactate dehydrogenase